MIRRSHSSPRPDSAGRSTLAVFGLALSAAALGLSACSDDATTATDPASQSTPEPAPAPLSCPASLGYLSQTGEIPPTATARGAVAMPSEAIACTYAQTGSDDGSGWTRQGQAHTLTAAELTSVFTGLSWTPAPVNRPCTMDLGPVSLLSWRAADTSVHTLAVEHFGCRAAYELPSPDEAATHGALVLPESTVTALAALTN